MYYYYYYYYEKEALNLYLKYKYLRASDTVRILKSLEDLYKDILKSIGKYEYFDEESNELLVFNLTIDEAKTGNSIKFKFGKAWEIKRKKKKIEEREVKQFELNISFGIRDVIVFLLILGVFNSPNQNINILTDNDKEKFYGIKNKLYDNQIWQQLQEAPKDTFINIENKARDLTNFFIQNQTITNVKIEHINIKNENNNR